MGMGQRHGIPGVRVMLITRLTLLLRMMRMACSTPVLATQVVTGTLILPASADGGLVVATGGGEDGENVLLFYSCFKGSVASLLDVQVCCRCSFWLAGR